MMNLKEARTKAGLTQAEVAKQLNVNQNTYSGWETGRANIDNNSLKKLAILFNVSVDYLLGLRPMSDDPKYPEDDIYVLYDSLSPLEKEHINFIIKTMASKNK